MSLIGLLFKPSSRLSSCTRSATVTRPISVCSHQKQNHTHRQRSCHSDDTRTQISRARREVERRAVEYVFIQGLVAASTCREHRKSLRSESGSECKRRLQRVFGSPLGQIRSISFSSPPRSKESVKPAVGPQISPEEYNNLVDIYPGFDHDPPPPVADPPDSAKQRQHFPLASSLVLTPEQEHNSTIHRRLVRRPQSRIHTKQLRKFVRLVMEKPGFVSQQRIWEAYEALPAPRVAYLTNKVIYKTFRHFIWVEFKDAEGGAAMKRYFALLNECISENVGLNDMVWNSAIAFSGRWMRQVTGDEVKAVVETWMQMEGAGYAATNVTFNILFDIAVRSGRYALADTIFGELRARKMPLNRNFRTSVIFYAGIKRDGDGVRKAFRELVESGEIVDTAVMNCVILSLLRAGEAPAAETVFARMIRLHEEKFGTDAPPDWRDMKELGNLLNETGEKLREEESQHEASFFGGKFSLTKKREELQKAAPIAPNANTYRILIKYHAYTSGDLPRIHTLLAEMKEKDFNVHGSVFVHVLRGFATHGGFAFSAWSRMSLENLWAEVAELVDIKAAPVNANRQETLGSFYLDDQHAAPGIQASFLESGGTDQENLSKATHEPCGTPSEDDSIDNDDPDALFPETDSSFPPTPSKGFESGGYRGMSAKPVHITDYDFSASKSSSKAARPKKPKRDSSLPSSSHSDASNSSSRPTKPPQNSSRRDDLTSEVDRPTYMTSSLAIAAVDAFNKVTGTKRMLHVWEEIQDSWHGADSEELAKVQSVVNEHVAENEKYVEWGRSGWTKDAKGSSGYRNRSRM